MLKWDGHTHTKFCRHGSDAEQEQYIRAAIEHGFERYTISEHPPLPDGWVQDRKLFEELAMKPEELPQYLEYAEQIKEQYADQLEITVGLELDYLPGQAAYGESIVDRFHHRLEDAVISVHFMRGKDGMRCIDYKPDDFREGLLSYYGSMDAVVEEYYNHVEEAMEWAANFPMRKRIGHLTLIEKFHQELPPIDEERVKRRLRAILPQLARHGIGIDVNTAGMRVPTCGKPYVPDWFLRECKAHGIVCVYGSDAHRPQHVGTGWDWFVSQMEGDEQ